MALCENRPETGFGKVNDTTRIRLLNNCWIGVDWGWSIRSAAPTLASNYDVVAGSAMRTFFVLRLMTARYTSLPRLFGYPPQLRRGNETTKRPSALITGLPSHRSLECARATETRTVEGLQPDETPAASIAPRRYPAPR